MKTPNEALWSGAKGFFQTITLFFTTSDYSFGVRSGITKFGNVNSSLSVICCNSRKQNVAMTWGRTIWHNLQYLGHLKGRGKSLVLPRTIKFVKIYQKSKT